ncbi:3'-5' exonuclease [Limnohabitans sp. Hippo4]|uniref:3'-5' exonuclease n=1 Tax=Limnohabitans sp. Hippo4 TaxID=1826167 RepID=UPI001E361E1A|nr:3'-5' exonuclease [Limnohabitans sp. Hippo4]
MNFDDMADQLSAHPDFKVKRRLVPILDFGPGTGGPTQRVLILDTETTGLDWRAESIIELAMLAVDVDMQTGKPVGEVEVYEDFEDPGRPIPPEIVKLTGITAQDVKGQRLNEEKIKDMVERADLIVAHNAGFDRPFVENRLEVFEHKAWACSFQGIDWKAQGLGSAKLEFLCSELGWFYDAHRAQVDCHALLRVLSTPLKSDKPEGAVTGLLQLFESSQNARTVVKAFGSPFETKDKLKARGYRWDAEARVWYTSVKSAAALDAEAEWLKAEVYGGRAARIGLETQDARVQFSSRSGKSGDRIL